MLSVPARDLHAIRRWNQLRVEYVIVGSHALRHHGGDRAARDVDIFVNTDESHRFRTWTAMIDLLGHIPHGMENEDTLAGKKQVPICEDGMRIDLLTSMPNLAFDEVYAARERVTQEGVEVPVMSRAHFIEVTKTVAATDPDYDRRAKALGGLALLGLSL